VLRDGKVLRTEKDFPVDWPSLAAARAWVVAAIGPTLEGPLRYCIESTGCYHMPVLRAFQGEPSVVNPLLAGPTRRKTDVLDARLLAHHSITGMWPASFMPGENGIQLRVLWARRAEAVRAATRSSNRINNIILRFGHTVASRVSVRSSEGLAIVESLAEGDVPRVPEVNPAGLPEPMRPVISELLRDLAEARRREADARSAATSFVRERRWAAGGATIDGAKLLRLLETVPGVGATTSLTWLSEVVDPARFKSADQVAAFCGCDPSLKVSAGKVTEHVRRKGNTRLHKALLYAASALMRRPEVAIGALGLSIAGRHKKGGHRKAAAAIARRLSAALWHVHRLAKPYDDNLYAFAQEPAFADGPLAAIGLTRAQVACLPPSLRTAGQVSRAYAKGLLAGCPGIGDAALKKISVWAQAHRIRNKSNQPEDKKHDEADRRRLVPEGHGGSPQAQGDKEPRWRAQVVRKRLRKDARQDDPGRQVVGRGRSA
jgi:transposase